MSCVGPLIGAIDQGTSSTRFIIFSTKDSSVITYHQIEVKRFYPQEGWVEQNPNELFNSVLETSRVVYDKLQQLDIDPQLLNCIGLTNQRESAIVWDKFTGEPLYNCIVWLDNRTSDIVDQVLDNIPGRDLNWLKKKTGLPISTYFTAFKLKWLINFETSVREAIEADRLLFGTVDSWILWKLTGIHATDVTNASRTMLMNIETLEWDEELCNFFDIPISILPKIRPSSYYFGQIKVGVFQNVPITGVIGDQNAALVGQQCFGIGQAKVTYGTGCFLIQNIGHGSIEKILRGITHEARKKLIITVGYQFGESNPVYYALEGSVSIAGAAITWLRDNLQIVNNYSEVENVAKEDKTTAGLYFVPALQGLYAPYWDPNATGTIIGLSQFSRKCHLVRATLEGVAFQANDILTMMKPDKSGIKVDGGMSSNDLLCQFLADISNCRIIRPKLTETTAFGAALIAGYTLNLWHSLESQNPNNYETNKDKSMNKNEENRIIANIQQEYDIFQPNLEEIHRKNQIETWKKAVNRSRRWIQIEKQVERKNNYKRLSALPFMLYVLLSFGTYILSTKN